MQFWLQICSGGIMRKAGLGRVLGVMCALATGAAVAGPIYSCDQDGHKVFSQEPCGANATVVQSETERSVTLSTDMSSGDISYLCSLAMRAWEMNADERRNMTSGYYYRGGSYDRSERRSTFVFSHIENLEKVAVNDPELYDVAKSIASRSFSGNSGSYLYGAERARAQSTCERDMRDSIDRVRTRRQAEDDCRFKRKDCRYRY